MAPHFTTPDQYIAQLEARITELEHNPDFDLPRRPVAERRWTTVNPAETAVIFIDLDGLHSANKRYGYAGVNARIRAAFGQLEERHRPDTVVCQWYGGDEFVILCPAGNAAGLCVRTQELLRQQGLGGSFAIVPVAGHSLAQAVEVAGRRLQAARSPGWLQKRRGIIVCSNGDVIGPPARLSLWGAR